MRKYQLIQRGQTAVYPQDVAERVRKEGFGKAAKHFGVGDSTLRKYLHEAGFRFSRRTSWQVEALPGLEARDAGENSAADVPTADAGTAEPTGEAGGLGRVEADGLPAGHQPLGVGTPGAE